MLRHLAHALALLAILLFPPLVLSSPNIANYTGLVIAWCGLATLVLAVGLAERRCALLRARPREDQEYPPTAWTADNRAWFIANKPVAKTKGDNHAP